MKRRILVLSTAVLISLGQAAIAADKPAAAPTTVPSAPAVLPGKGLAEHDFLYAGESRDRKIFIVRKGEVVWTYDDPKGAGEISDAVLLSNGNVLFAHQFAVELISPDKKVLWKYDAPKGCEVHTAMPIGKEHVLYIQNGPEPVLRVVNIATDKTVKEFPLPVKNAKSTHGQFRHARLTPAGTILVAHMDMGKVCEYDSNGKELWSFAAPGCWGVTPLPNGNVLITDPKGVHEVNREQKTVWEITRADLPDYKMPNLQLAWRLPNGNTLLNIWVNEWSGKIDKATAPAQALEVTPDKKVVWALRAWTPPVDLGPATTIQILDQAESPENVTFGEPARPVDGSWKVVKRVKNAQATPEKQVLNPAVVLTFDGAAMTERKGDGDPEAGAVAFDDAKSPKRIIMTGKTGPHAGQAFVGIYELSGDTLKIAYSLKGDQPPDNFDGGEGAGLLVLERVKAAAVEPKK